VRAAIEWGDVPTWVGACGTVGALAFAAAAAFVGWQLYKVESRRDHDTEQDRRSREFEQRRAQAARISAWPSNTGEDAQGNVHINTLGILVRNASELPIFDLAIRFYWRQGPSSFQPLWQTSPSGEWPDGQKALIIPVLPPSDHPVFIPIPQEVFEKLHGSLHDKVVPSLSFRDAEGISWHRGSDGKLAEAT
jgi:hypothetical protein